MSLEKKINKPNQISTSIRFPVDVYNYVDSLSGRSFTSKLIGLIRDDMNGSSNRRKSMDDIYDLILQSKLQLQSTIVTLQDNLSFITGQVSDFEKNVNYLLDSQFFEFVEPPEVEEFVPPEYNDELPFN